MKKYDVIIIGAGSAGLGNSGVAKTIGLDTLLIERNEAYFGGDCTNFGCVPSKALIHIASQFHAAKNIHRFGVDCSGKADMKKILQYIHEKQEIIRDTEDAEALRAQGMDVVIGEAKFKDKNTIRVGEEEFTARVILLCTGSKPRAAKIPGLEQTKVYTNENIFFDCTELPDHLVVIGGGAIGCELGQCFARLGSKVTLVNRGERILKKEPESVSKILEEVFTNEGITVLNNAEVKKFTDKTAVIENKNGEQREIPCDATLIAIGRVVNTKSLGLEAGGIALTEKGKIKHDAYFKTTNPKVYVIGDAAGTYMFSHGAEKMVRMLWRNLLIPVFKKKDQQKDLSWVTFTEPQVAHFGLTEKQMHDQNISYYRQDQNLEHDDRAIIQEYTYGEQKLWIEGSGRLSGRKILSGSLIAPNAGEMVQELELAKHAGIPIGKINNRVYPYPVQSRINQKTTRGILHAAFKDWQKKLGRMAFRWFN